MPRAFRPPRIVTDRVRGFTGIRDQRSPVYRPGEVEAVFNMVPEALDRPSKLLVRQGFKRTVGATAGRLATSGTYRLTTAAFYSVFGAPYAISGGEIYSVAAVAITKTVTTADLATAGVAITDPVEMVEFNRKLIVAPEDERPWSYDGTSGAGGIVSLTNAPLDVGDVTVYAGKLFFIKRVNGIGREIVWSEELAENTGYEAGGFDNKWDLTVSSPHRLSYIVGLEDGLYVFREQGVTVIRGQVNANFRTTATRDAISETFRIAGNVKRFKPVAINGTIWCWDELMRPWALRAGVLVPIWRQLARAWGPGGVLGTERDPWDIAPGPDEGELVPAGFAVSNSRGFIWPDHDWGLVLMATARTGGVTIYGFDPLTFRLVTVWGPMALVGTSLGGLLTIADNQFLATAIVNGDGYVFYLPARNTNGNFNDEAFDGAGVPVQGTVIGPPHGHTLTGEHRYIEARALIEARANHTVRFAYVSSRNHKGSLAPAALTFQENPSNVPFEERVRFGIDELARWLRPAWQVEAQVGSTAQPGLYGYELDRAPDGMGDAR